VAHVRTERDEEDLVRLYLNDVGRYPLLAKDDEARLAQAIEARSQAEQDLLATDTALTPPWQGRAGGDWQETRVAETNCDRIRKRPT